MAKLWGDKGVWLILHIFLLLPALDRSCFPRSEQMCNTQPMQKCHITIYDIKDIVHSNYMYMYTVFKCPDYGSDTTLHWSLNPCCSGDYIDTVVNLTSGVRTTIDCSLSPTYQSYTWRMEAPPGLRVLLTVPRHHVSNIIGATDEEDRGNPYIFAANSFAEDGDYFLSSSHVVYMEATLEGSDPKQFIVIGEVVNITSTIKAISDLMNCSIPSHDAGENHWDNETQCENDMVSFKDSCYHFISQSTDLDNARKECEEMSGFHLVFIDSSEEQDFLAMASTPNANYWIGIEKNGDGEHVWMDGSPIIYNKFIKTPQNMEECFWLESAMNYVWEHEKCKMMNPQNGYICEREQGYHGNNSNDKGCAAFEAKLPVLTDSDDGILIKFSYYIKTFNGSDNSRTAMLWTGTYIILCNPSDFSNSSQSGLEISVSCQVSSNLWAVNIQASGVGLVKISDMQLFIVGGTTASVTIGPVPSSTTLVSTTSPTTSSSQRITASTGMTGSLGTSLSSSSPPSTSPLYPFSKSTMHRSTPSIGTHSSSPPVITTESSESQERSSGMNKSVIPIVVVLLIVLLIALIVGVFWYKRRGKLATSKRNQQSRSSNGTVQNPTFENDVNEHEYAEYSEKPSTKGTIRTSSSEDAQQHIYTDLPASASKDNNGVIYNEVGEQDYNVPFGGKEMGDYHEYNLPDSDHGRSNAKKPTNEDAYQELSEDGKRCSPKGTEGTTRIGSSEDAQQHVYTDLPLSASKDNNGVIYNEVGEQDYNVPFGGKEMGDYHEYNLPDSDHCRSNAKKPTNEDSYQELSEDEKRCSPKGTGVHALPGMKEKAIESQPKVGDLNRTGDHAYQDLRKDDGGYTSLQNSLGLPQKPVTKVTAAELENSYQALNADAPAYFTLKPDETKPSPNPDNLQNSTYQPLRQEPEYAILESQQSDNPAKPEDNTYQSLLKDAITHADSDTELRKDNTPKQGQSDPYDVLQRGPKTKQLSLDGYGSLGPTAKEEEEHDYESPEGKPQATTDYEDPIQDNSVADGPYDSIQRKTMPEPPRSSPSLANRAVDDGDDDDYETPDRSNDDPTDANYQTLDNRQEKYDSGNEEYSHLQRSLGANLSHVPNVVSDNSNQYGKLNYGNSAAN